MPFRPHILAGLATLLLALFLRLPQLGAILTVDEPQWIFRAQSFYTALRRGDLGGTFQGTHPGVVPILLIGAGIRAQELLTGTTLESPRVGTFRIAGKLPMVLAVSVGIGVATTWAVLLWGMRAGILGGALLALDPFFVGHGRLAHVDALLAILMLLSMLALLLYVRQREWRLLLLSGVLGGLALLTKLPALLLLPSSVAILLLFSKPAKDRLRESGAWIAAAAITFFLLWPSMWGHVFPNVGYFVRDAYTVSTIPHSGHEEETVAQSPTFYLRALLNRTTPLILLLGSGGLLLLLRSPTLEARRQGTALLIMFLGFFLLLNLVEKRGDRYLLPALLILDLAGGIGLAQLFRHPRLGPALVALGLGALLVINLTLQPYALAYSSPFGGREELTQAGWGEGLEEAARILNEHPLAPELHVATWYPEVFREFFRGISMTLSSRDDPRVDYVVLYRNMYGRSPEHRASAVVAEFRNQEPVAVIRVLGVEMAWIYARDSVDRFPKHVGEIVRPGSAERGTGNAPTAQEVGQRFTAEQDGLTGVRLLFATFSSRKNRGEVLLHVRENPAGADLRTVRIDISSLEDNGWRTIRFEPLPNSRGKTYSVTLTSPTGEPGNAVTVRYQPKDILPGNLIVLRQPLREGERRTAFALEGDLAYAPEYADASR